MTLSRLRLVLLGVVLLTVCTQPVAASAPRVVMIYGNGLQSPVVLNWSSPSDDGPFSLFWFGSRSVQSLSREAVMAELADRPYFDVAIFWAALPSDQLVPRNATQHGRFYPAAGALPPAMAVMQLNLLPTLRHLAAPNDDTNVVPVPADLTGFPSVWTFGPDDIAVLKRLGVPGV